MDASNSIEETSVPEKALVASAEVVPRSGVAASTGASAIRWIIPGLISEGLTVLAGEAKSGKSWLALDLALAVATGGVALGAIASPTGNVFYVDLENGENRLEERRHVLLGGRKADLWRLEFLHEPSDEPGFVDLLDAWHAAVANPRLAVVDAPLRLGAIGGGRVPRRELRERELGALQQWALRHRVAVLAIARAAREDATSDESLAAADTTLLLDRKAGQPMLTIHSRDQVRRKMTLAFDAGCWSIVDPGDGSRRDVQRAEILAVLRTSVWEMSPRRVAQELGLSTGNVTRMMSRMARDGEVARCHRGKYILPKPGLRGSSFVPTVLPPELEQQWIQEHRRDEGRGDLRPKRSRKSGNGPD